MKKLYFLFAVLPFAFSLYAQPIPLFSTDADAYCMPDDIVCMDTSILVGVPVQSWSWTLDGTEVSTQQNPTIPVDGYTPGAYQLCMALTYGPPLDGVIDVNCKDILLGEIPVIDAGPDEVLSCVNTATVLSVNVPNPGTYTYLWSGPSGTATTQDILVTLPGTYTVEVKDIAGCTATDDVIVNQDIDIPLIDITPVAPVDCSSPVNVTLSATVSPAGNYTYQWTTVDGIIGSGANTLTPVVNAAGVYTLTAANNLSGCVNSSVVQVVADGNFTILGVSDTTICLGDNIILDQFSPDAVSYYWPHSGATTSSVLVSPTVTTSYAVFALDANGCSVSKDILVNVSQGPDATISVPGLICSNDSFEVCAVDNPDNTYTWVNPQGAITNDLCVDVNNPDPSSNGTYTLTVVDLQGCTSSNSFDHTVAPPMTVTTTTQDISCFGSTDGVINIAVTGGTLPYTYDWGGGISCLSTDCFNLAAGTYAVTITDANGCTAVETVTIVEPDLLMIPNYTIECAGDDGLGGAIDITLTGGVPPLSYQWSNNEIIEDIENLAVGDYVITITDANNCQLIHQFTVENNCVWPGDTDTNNVVNNYDLLNIGLVYDSTGLVRNAASLSWYGQVAQDWGQTIPGSSIDYKHADTDGNGIINTDDTLAISLNWGQSHNLLESSSSPRNTVPLYVLEDTISQGEMMSLPIILGDMDNPAIDIYGIAFSVTYDTSVVSFGSSDISFMNSWLGVKGMDMITIQKDFPVSGRVDLAISRIDGMNISGSGEIGRLNIIIEDDILLLPQHGNPRGGNDDEKQMSFVIDRVKLINKDGEILEVNPLTTTSLITKFPVSTTIDPALEQKLSLYPNPTRDFLRIQADALIIEQVEIFSAMGQLLKTQLVEDTNIILDTKNLSTGTYLIKIKTDQGTIVKRASIMR